MSDAVHFILDESALLAAGYGNVMASGLIHRSAEVPGWYVHVPVCTLVEADRRRPGTAEHFASLPGITVLELDLPAALALARETTWADAHTRYAAAPTPERPDGAVIATTAPEKWRGAHVRVLDLSPDAP
ncbi:PIN domain-containing protein [Streptomyces harbinensis]|uniref:hypothetical protein n=1 Tax=Streptomyces harbinensis TaxID=1176198 RepID=UPI0036AF2AA7